VSTHVLDVPELHQRLDKRRQQRGLTWRGLGRLLNISQSTFSRLARGHRPDADALITLLVWLNLDNELAVVIKPKEPTP